MATTGHKASSEGSDFLIDVARSIGSTLGSVAAKVNRVTAGSHPRRKRAKAPRKRSATVRAARSGRRRTAAGASKTARKTGRHARRNQKRNQKKSPK
jgi:hypothetical protein